MEIDVIMKCRIYIITIKLNSVFQQLIESWVQYKLLFKERKKACIVSQNPVNDGLPNQISVNPIAVQH